MQFSMRGRRNKRNKRKKNKIKSYDRRQNEPV
jgi:hypothetical protein